MPVRGARDTQPYHWDGIPGDPYGGINTANIQTDVDANCSADDPKTCTRHLVDGSLATTMCELDTDDTCPHTNDEDKPGLLSGEERDSLATYILSAPYPPAPNRAYDNALTASARRGHFDFSFVQDSSEPNTGTQTCGSCHKMPFLVSTNTPGTGMDAPTWRGAYDRWMLLPQGRLNIIDLMQIVNMGASFPERDMWILAGASSRHLGHGPPDQHRVPGRLRETGDFEQRHGPAARDPCALVRAMETAAKAGSVILQGEGVRKVRDTDRQTTRDRVPVHALQKPNRHADIFAYAPGQGRGGRQHPRHIDGAPWTQRHRRPSATRTLAGRPHRGADADRGNPLPERGPRASNQRPPRASRPAGAHRRTQGRRDGELRVRGHASLRRRDPHRHPRAEPHPRRPALPADPECSTVSSATT